jgi:hypothetical protein
MGALGPASPRRLDRADITVAHAPPNQEMLRQAREWFTKALKADPQLTVAKEFMRRVTTSREYCLPPSPQMMTNITQLTPSAKRIEDSISLS